MKKIITAVVLALAMALGTIGVAGMGAASASTSRTYVYTRPNWSKPAIRPSSIEGVGYAPYGVRHMHWSSWGQSSAFGYGQSFGYFNSENHQTKYGAYVALYRLRIHHGHRYFSRMKVAAPHHKTRYYTIGYQL